jgi:hypothetical protein
VEELDSLRQLYLRFRVPAFEPLNTEVDGDCENSQADRRDRDQFALGPQHLEDPDQGLVDWILGQYLFTRQLGSTHGTSLSAFRDLVQVFKNITGSPVWSDENDDVNPSSFH